MSENPPPAEPAPPTEPTPPDNTDAERIAELEAKLAKEDKAKEKAKKKSSSDSEARIKELETQLAAIKEEKDTNERKTIISELDRLNYDTKGLDKESLEGLRTAAKILKASGKDIVFQTKQDDAPNRGSVTTVLDPSGSGERMPWTDRLSGKPIKK